METHLSAGSLVGLQQREAVGMNALTAAAATFCTVFMQAASWAGGHRNIAHLPFGMTILCFASRHVSMNASVSASS